VEPFRVVLRSNELLAQGAVFGAQPLAQLDELFDLRLQRVELRLHRRDYVANFKLRQEVTTAFACTS